MGFIRWSALRCALCIVFFGTASSLFLSSSFAAPDVAHGELLVRFRKGAAQTVIDHATHSAKLKIRRQLRTAAMKLHGHPGLSIVTTDLDLTQALAILRKDPAVECAEPNFVFRPSVTSNDPVFSSGDLWGMYGDLSSPANPFGSQAAEAWAAGYVGSSSVYVAVIDDGMQITHPDLSPNVWTNPFDPVDGIDNDGNGFVDDINGWNFVSTNNNVFNGDGHGTHVAGTIGARGGNGSGVAGVNWNVTLIPLKFISNGTGNTADAIEAIDYCVGLKALHNLNLVAINASWGGGGYSSELHEAIIRAAKAGILFVVAAGNSGLDNDGSDAMPANMNTSFGTLNETPASYNSVISVAAIDSMGALASFSDYGATRVHIGAPGVLIYSTYPTNLIGGLSGTSMATPHVTGAVALYASTHPTATANQIRSAILNAATPTTSLNGKVSTGGRLNLSDIVVPAPSIAAAGAVLSSEIWTNGVIDPGETVSVQLTITNLTPFATANLVGTLQQAGDVSNPSAPHTFGALAGGGTARSGTFSFTAAGTCGQDITLTLALQDGATNLGTVSFSLPLGNGTNVFIENFNSVTAPALPSGWTATLSGAGAQWKTVTGFSSSGINAIYAPNPGAASDNCLTSPLIHINSGSARLSFKHSFVLEPGWDGGVLEISIAGGAFTDIITAGGTFRQNGYTLLLNSSTSPLPSRWAWSGRSDGYINTAVELPVVCHNQDIQLRWRCGSDSSIGGTGWYMDSVSITDGAVCSLPDVTLDEDTLSPPISFLIGQADTQSGLQLSAGAANAALMSGVNFAGTGRNRSVTLSPATNQFGTTVVTLKVDSSLATSYRTFHLTLNPVNDPPSFTPGSDLISPQDSGAQSIPAWATSISSGPSNESAQQMSFTVMADDPSLFSIGPWLNSSGTLSYTPALHRRGVANISVQLSDDGGTARAGVDASSVANFTITIGASTDSDGDGIPDDFETAFGLNPNSTADASLDLDGDGFTNLQEFIAGTDPSDPRSLLRIVAAADASSASGVQFSSVVGKTYAVEENSNYPSASWVGVASGKSGSGSLVTQADAGASGTRRLYRVSTVGELGGTVSSEYAGFSRLTLLGNSDTFVSIPFSRPPQDFGAVLSVSGNVVQLRGSPGWSANEWVYNFPTQTNAHYMLIRSGAMNGEYFTITGNTADSLIVDVEGGSLSQLAAGDSIAIVPYWTFGTIFPGGQGVRESTSPAIRDSEVLLANVQGTGLNFSAGATYYFYAGSWRKAGQGSVARNDDVILPNMYFIVRHNVSGDTTLTTEGLMLAGKSHIQIRRQAGAAQDNSIALDRPFALSLNSSDLIESGTMRASPSQTSHLDELLVFDNTAVRKNKSAAASYYYWNGAWRKIGAGSANVGTDIVFTPGAGVILRSGAGTTTTWELPSPY
jgi:uncharacterized protein (TIGR02597 family)